MRVNLVSSEMGVYMRKSKAALVGVGFVGVFFGGRENGLCLYVSRGECHANH
jgi:hypothetical protein